MLIYLCEDSESASFTVLKCINSKQMPTTKIIVNISYKRKAILALEGY